MNLTIEEIKLKLRKRLIEHGGNIEPHLLTDIIAEAKAIGLSDKDIARLVPEVDQSINWQEVAEQNRLALEEQEKKEQGIIQAAHLMDAMIDNAFNDGKIEQEELRELFKKSGELQQDDLKVSKKIYARIKRSSYKPYPEVDLNVKDLKEFLLSTSWYNSKNYAIVLARQTAEVIPVQIKPVKPQPPEIHYFQASKPKIKKGEEVILYWHVSGVETIVISGLGEIRLSKGQRTVTPISTTTYALKAGDQVRYLEIIMQPKRKSILLWLLLFFMLYILSKACGKSSESALPIHTDSVTKSPDTTYHIKPLHKKQSHKKNKSHQLQH